MTLEKAIKVNTTIMGEQQGRGLTIRIDAIKLGIEAMKAMKILRSPGSPHYPHILPGETLE